MIAAPRGWGRPVQEYRFAPPRRWRFDYAWPSRKVAIEVEGGVWIAGRHTRGKGYIRDLEKYNEAALLGWTVLRYTPAQMRDLLYLRDLQRLEKARIALYTVPNEKAKPIPLSPS